MSIFGTQKFIFQLKKDKALQSQFRSDADNALAVFPLSDDERQALKAGDLASLYRMGVHPLLLAPYARFMGISRPSYQETLSPFRGQFVLRS
ncbi:MAG: hypothetical protein AB1490_08400 [Pseudomonadota bacterium]